MSTDSKEQLNSYAAQQNYCTQKTEELPDWEMAGIFADEGLTGTSMKKRSEFNRMIAACQQGGTFFTMGGASGHNIQDGILKPDEPLFKKKCQRLDASGAMYRVNHSP